MSTPSSQTQRAATALLVVLAGLAVAQSWELGQGVAGIDYYQFWVVGEAVEHDGVTNPYTDEERARMGQLFAERANRNGSSSRNIAVASSRSVLETYSTPFLYTAIHGLSSGDYDTDFTRWHFVSLFSFVAGVIGFANLLGYSWLASLVLLCALLLRFAPLQSEVQVLNVNSVQLGLLALVLLLVRKTDSVIHQVAAGFALGVGAMFKPNIALVVLLLGTAALTRGNVRPLLQQTAGTVAGVGFAFIASVVFFGSAECWIAWSQTIAWIPPEIIKVEMGNYAPLVFVAGEGAAKYSSVFALLLCVPVVVALASSGDKRPAAPQTQATAMIGLGCGAFILSANLVWEHYYILAIPLLLLALQPGVARRPEGIAQWSFERVLPGIALLGLMATPTYALIGLPHEIYFPLVQGSSVLVLYSLVLARMFSHREEEAL